MFLHITRYCMYRYYDLKGINQNVHLCARGGGLQITEVTIVMGYTPCG